MDKICILLICVFIVANLNAQNISLFENNDYQFPSKIITNPTCTICNPSDSLALVTLYNSTDGNNWTTSWDLSQPVESWHGVALNENCCVIGLDLSRDENNVDGNNLIGIIPNEIGNLDSLEYLALANNVGLTGPIPTTIANLSNLNWLGLFRCNLQDTIPKELAQLSELTYFSASVNQLSGNIPVEIGTMQNLETFFVSYNQLSGELPIHLGNLSNLEGLGLSGNQFTGQIPNEYFNLSKLRFLYLADNQLYGDLPNTFDDFSDLILLYLNNNNFTGRIPSSIAASTFLTFLDLSENQLIGGIPSAFGNSNFLNTLKLYSNQFNGIIPTEILKNQKIDQLYLQNNNLEACYDDMEDYCMKDFEAMPSDTFVHFGDSLFFYNQDGYNFTQNLKMAWFGDIIPWCNGTTEIAAPCDDGDPNTTGEYIRKDCRCSDFFVANYEIVNIQSINIFPNLIQKNESLHVQIQTSKLIDLKVRVLNSFGQVLKEEKLNAFDGENNFQIQLPTISTGIYFLDFFNNNQRIIKKFGII